MLWSADRLFSTYFLSLYPADTITDAASLERTRREDANPAANRNIIGHLHEAAEKFVANAGALFGSDLTLDFSDASIHRLSAALTPAVRDRWASQGDGAANLLFNALVHGAAYVGECVVRNHGGEWRVRRPLWESLVELRSAAGTGELAVFHWLLKSIADDAPSTLADRYRAYVEVPRGEPVDLPRVFAERAQRGALPRIAKPRYDILFRYVKAHLSAIRDLGDDFPSAARFDEFGFRWLDALVVGDGRMVVLGGPGRHGVHLFWLSGRGFHKSIFFSSDSAADPRFSLSGDLLKVTIERNGTSEIHEMLWWGP